MTVGQFIDHNSPLVAQTKLKARMGSNRLARQSFGMFKVRKDRILFKLFLSKKKEIRKMNKIEIFKFGFLDSVKGWRTFRLKLA